ncbi:hypothetical protein V8C44DRAFT_325970 [Trichoderma aethiopicum]
MPAGLATAGTQVLTHLYMSVRLSSSPVSPVTSLFLVNSAYALADLAHLTRKQPQPTVLMGQEISAAGILAAAMSDEPDTVKTTTKTVTRNDVMDEMKPILRRLSDDKWTAELSADIAAILTPHKLKVMPPRSKAVLAEWIYEQEDQKYLQWLKNASDDLLSVTWSETKRIPGPKIWSPWHPANLHLDMLEEALDDYSPEQKESVQSHIKKIKEYLQCEKERESQQVEQFTAPVLEAIERVEDRIIDRFDTYLDQI